MAACWGSGVKMGVFKAHGIVRGRVSAAWQRMFIARDCENPRPAAAPVAFRSLTAINPPKGPRERYPDRDNAVRRRPLARRLPPSPSLPRPAGRPAAEGHRAGGSVHCQSHRHRQNRARRSALAGLMSIPRARNFCPTRAPPSHQPRRRSVAPSGGARRSPHLVVDPGHAPNLSASRGALLPPARVVGDIGALRHRQPVNARRCEFGTEMGPQPKLEKRLETTAEVGDRLGSRSAPIGTHLEGNFR